MKPRRIGTYLLAIALPLAVFFLRNALQAAFGDRPLLILFMPALLAVSLLGGLWPGLLATLTAGVLTAFLLPPAGTIWVAEGHNFFQWSILVASGAMAAVMAERLLRSRAAQEAALVRLRHRDAESRMQRRRLRDILEGTNVGTWEWNVQSGAVAVNERWAEIVGYTRAELGTITIATWNGLAHPDDVARSEDLLKRHFAGELPHYECDTRLKHKAGHWVWVLDKGKVSSWTDDGKPLLMSGTHQDITQRKEAQQRLADSEQRLVLATAAAKMGVWEYEFAADRLYWSPELFAALGLPPCEPSRALCRALEHNDDRGISDAAMERAIANRTPYFAQYRVVVNGETKWVEDHGTIQYAADGRPERVIGLAQDITQQKRSELELQQHRQHLEELVAVRTADLQQASRRLADTQFAMDRVGIGIHWVDPETGRFVYVNEAAASIVGYTVEQMLGMGVPDIDPAFAADFPRRVAVIRDRGFMRVETRARHCDGRMIPVEVSIYWLPDAGGGAGRFISFLVDITERKQAEEEMREARLAAEAATIAKSAFLANMSHEIRTPMNGILGMAYLVRRGGVTPRQADQLDKIATAGAHLLAIINDVLDLAKIESGRFDLVDADFARDDLVRGVSSLVAESARAKGLVFTVDLDEIPARLRGDRTRLEQALVNYLGNAVKFTERGAISLRGTVLEETDHGVTLKFEVRDTGIGIPAAALGRLYTAFQQVDQSSTRRVGGTGLGLAITKRIAEAMGGEVGVDSIPGEGSTFWLTVRLRRADNAAAGTATAHAGPGELLARNHAGARVLVVDDEDLNREVACDLLREFGLAPEAAAGGDEAVRMVQANRYRVILMDVKMPGMDGLMATRAIRALPTGNAVPIVAVTANVYAEDRRDCLDAGMNGFVAKPLEPEKLNAALLECLEVTA